ncbi:Type III restriction-modification system methylation subunit [hydrothermal vent metagenome]|uniref:Type III restriction-modification system methylation subunit n=1 Tax=hydrothermal vent metagenome TaxID=652676 RepID=A0A1W1CLV9_9ZZZZ
MPKKKSIYDNSHITANSKQLDLLKQHFPNCFDKEGNFISHKMEEIVGNAGLELSRESYSLNWLGKSYARLLANENPLTLLREDKVHNAKEENRNSENLLIKGDNLEVLKHLVNAYSEQIKMIYIDPPYNTGGDGFVYNDDRKFTVEELQKLAGVERDEAKRILEFTASKANSHSAWLTFMYPRLYVARELLREDGVIFISIDDNEVSQLKLLCDEVFGEENFVSIISNVNNPKGRSDDGFIATSHEYGLIYKKNEPKIFGWKPDEKIIKRFNKKDEEGRIYREIDLRKTGDNDRREDRPNLFYYFLFNKKTKDLYISKSEDIPNGYIQIKPIKENGEDGNWRWEEKTALLKFDLLIPKYMKVRERWGIFEKDLLENKKNIKPTSTWTLKEVNSERGSEQFIGLGLKKEIFKNPKPLGLIQKVMEFGLDTNDTILDFFAGSGTTAHAVMALNAEDGGNRKFITVQIPEKTDSKSEAYKAGYETIFDITKARIEKASEQLQDKSGFKIFETTPIFEGYLDELEELNEKTTLFNGAELSTDELETLLTTWKVHDGMKLHEPLAAMDLGGYVAYGSSNTLYFMDKGFNVEALKAFVAKLDDDETFEPSKLVLFGYNFDSKHQREFKEALNNYTNKKSIELDMVVRY